TIKSNSDKRKKVKKVLAITLGSIGAVAILVVAACLLWWYGFFLPRWIKWEKEEAAFEALNVTLKGRKVRIYDASSGTSGVDDSNAGGSAQDGVGAGDAAGKAAGGKSGGASAVLWETQADWFVQDMLVKDINRDGADELILLVWKHGSYGDSMPFWEEKNDKELHQHIFIYKYDPKKENKVRPLWMSSQILYEIESISSGKDSFLDVTDHEGTTRTWIWQDFGLKLVR
ncbi:MAG: hypothetical protein IJL09_04895, partial [Lachnospiraceae bacterium]|nr:hypothetical protein [Lachnospiraceae bacterium]